MTPSPEDQNALVVLWNHNHPVGTEVIRKDDLGKDHKTRTRSEAWVLGGHTAVIMVEGISGGYLLNRIRTA